MNPIDVRPVRRRRERRTFLTFPWRIYRGDPLWVPPLLPERAKAIDPERGAFFKRGGEAEFFIAWRDGVPVGTICAGEDAFANERRNRRECVIGFFEYVEDYAVAEALLDRAAAFARERDLNALWGPFNLNYEDSYGVLIEGRDRPPALLCGHTPSYYQAFMERYGFRPARGDNVAFEHDLDLASPEVRRISRVARKLRERRNIRVRQVDLDRWDEELDAVHRLLNRAMAHLSDRIGWHRTAVESMLAPFRDIADPELVLFAEVDGETVAWFPGLPNLNEALIHANGLRYPWDYVKLWWHTRRQPECLSIKSVLVLPEYWGTGVAVILFDEMARRASAKGYKWVDLSLTSAENPNTFEMAQRLGARIYKRYRVYRRYL
jgi:GNAT superfamily N-acetyltransferase